MSSKSLILIQPSETYCSDSASQPVECISIKMDLPGRVWWNRTSNKLAVAIKGHLLQKPFPAPAFETCSKFKPVSCICIIKCSSHESFKMWRETPNSRRSVYKWPQPEYSSEGLKRRKRWKWDTERENWLGSKENLVGLVNNRCCIKNSLLLFVTSWNRNCSIVIE